MTRSNQFILGLLTNYIICDLNKIKSDSTLTDLIVNCLPIQATFSSTLECFYNQLCLDILLSGISKENKHWYS
ncbi:hypothetical protein I4U23_017032 [Adineta vaga]|nr:hypothetical protein I4U23_017032 [Adineta vaga]